MMSEMIERGARALAKAQSGVDDWDALDDAFQENLKEHVAAVLLAMREPSDEMLESFGIHKTRTRQNWQAMIDAALA